MTAALILANIIMKNATKPSDDRHDGIVLNRMYVGEYLLSNMGHEIINLFCADNGTHYLYLNATGIFARKHKNCVRYMLLVVFCGDGLLKVVGLATGLSDVYDGKSQEVNTDRSSFVAGVTYNGVPLDIFFKNNKQQDIFITYKAEAVYRPAKGKQIFIRFNNSSTSDMELCNSDDVVVTLTNTNLAKSSLKQYFYSNKDSEDHAKLQELINDKALWSEYSQKAPTSENELQEIIDEYPINCNQHKLINKCNKYRKEMLRDFFGIIQESRNADDKSLK